MEQLFTSLDRRQSMLLLTAVTFGGQEGVSALELLPEEQAELLSHRAQQLLQIPRAERIPLLVQEIKRLVKDQRGRLANADPARLAVLLRRERAALVEVVLRALPVDVAEQVRALLPNTRRVRLVREVRPQVLDIVRWKLEELLARDTAPPTALKFTDVILLRSRELFTLLDRLGARVLGPALAGLADEERERMMATLPPHLRQLASKAVTANAPRKLAEERARTYLQQLGAMEDLSTAIRSAGTQRLARACLHQSAEFAARMVERHRGDFGQLFARWVREERNRPPSRGDGGRADIVMDMERLAARGLIDRPVRLRPPALKPPMLSGGSAQRPSRPPSLREVPTDPRRRPSGPGLQAPGAAERPQRAVSKNIRRSEPEPERSQSRSASQPQAEEALRIIRPPRSASQEAPRRSDTDVPPRRQPSTPGGRNGSSGRGPGQGTS